MLKSHRYLIPNLYQNNGIRLYHVHFQNSSHQRAYLLNPLRACVEVEDKPNHKGWLSSKSQNVINYLLTSRHQGVSSTELHSIEYIFASCIDKCGLIDWFTLFIYCVFIQELDRTWEDLHLALGRKQMTVTSYLSAQDAMQQEQTSSCQIYRLLGEMRNKSCTAKVIQLTFVQL